jgi:hypothetical protein
MKGLNWYFLFYVLVFYISLFIGRLQLIAFMSKKKKKIGKHNFKILIIL